MCLLPFQLQDSSDSVVYCTYSVVYSTSSGVVIEPPCVVLVYSVPSIGDQAVLLPREHEGTPDKVLGESGAFSISARVNFGDKEPEEDSLHSYLLQVRAS